MANLEIRIEHLHLTIRGIRSGNGTRKVLCVHGWLDNANSFKPLMALLPEHDVVAIDLPGHGHSDHARDPYTLAHHAHTVLQVAEQLGWKEFHLIGHSLGGCIAPFSATACPEKIISLVLIDAIGPQSESAEQLPTRLVRFHNDLAKLTAYKSRVFETIEQAVESRLRANKMNRDSARLIVERQLQQTPNGFTWRFDPKLRAASASYFTENQVKAVLGAVSCPVQCLLADNGYFTDRQKIQDRLNCIKNLQLQTLPGHHHLHLDNPDIVASAIREFIN